MRALGGIEKKRDIGLKTHLGEAESSRQDHSHAHARRDGRHMRTEREPNEKDFIS